MSEKQQWWLVVEEEEDYDDVWIPKASQNKRCFSLDITEFRDRYQLKTPNNTRELPQIQRDDIYND